MANSNHKKAGVGSSYKIKDGMPEPIALGRAHKSGKTVPLFNAERMDKLERNSNKKSGGVKK